MQEKVSAAARWVAGQLEPELRRRLRETYGAGWLEAVNTRRRAEGRAPGRSLRDHRFCLAVFAYDPATEGWVEDELRRRARVLIGLANSAVHDDVRDQDLARVREIVAVFADHLGVDPPAALAPGAGPPPDSPDSGPEPATRRKADGRRQPDRADERGQPDRADVATRRRLARERLARRRSRPGAWLHQRMPGWAKPVGIGVLVVAGAVGAVALVQAHGVAALLGLPFIIALAILALYLSLWVVAFGGVAWAIFLFTQHDNLSAVIFLWLSVLAMGALYWLHEELL